MLSDYIAGSHIGVLALEGSSSIACVASYQLCDGYASRFEGPKAKSSSIHRKRALLSFEGLLNRKM